MNDESAPSEVESAWPRRPITILGWDVDGGMYRRVRVAPDGSIYARTVVEPFRGVEVTPSATGNGETVATGSGRLYSAESPLGGPAVTLLDDGSPIAFLSPGTPMDFAARPRRFTGPLTALAVGTTLPVAILLDLVLD